MAARALPAGAGLAVHNTFGGLRLDVDPEELGFQGAIDLTDVAPSRDGGLLLPRPGFQRWHADVTSLGSAVQWIWSDISPTTNAQFVSGFEDIVVVVYNAGNSVIGVSSADGHKVVNALTPTSPILDATRYASNDAVGLGAVRPYITGISNCYRAIGATWTSVAVPGSRLINSTPWDRRLVLIGDGGGGGNFQEVRISFSNPDDATVFGANNWVVPAPGVGGLAYTASVRWREQLFIFRPGAFLVFTGTSTDNIGNPVFDYRVVDYGVGAVARHAACPAPEGVYFLSADGLYITAGGAPVRVSDQIAPLLSSRSDPSGNFTWRVNVSSPITMAYRDGCVYMTFTGDDATKRTLVYDTTAKTWWLWSFSGAAVAAADPTQEAGSGANRSGLWIGGPTVDPNSVWRWVPNASGVFQRGQDFSVGGGALANFNWSYRTGYDNLGAPGDKTIRRAMIDGTGTITRKLFDERNTGLTYADETVALGATRAQKWLVKSARARAFSTQLSGSGDFSVARIEHHLGRLRQPLLDSR